MTTETIIQLTFKLEDNESTYTMEINDLKPDVLDATIKTAAESIITNNIFAPKGLDLTSLVKAQRVTRSVTDVAI